MSTYYRPCERSNILLAFLFFCGGNISIIKHILHFFSDSPASGWRHNKRYYLIYTHRFCWKREELKTMSTHKLFRICSRKKPIILSWEPVDANNHSLDILKLFFKKQKIMIAVFVQIFDSTGIANTNQGVPNDPCVFFGSS